MIYQLSINNSSSFFNLHKWAKFSLQAITATIKYPTELQCFINQLSERLIFIILKFNCFNKHLSDFETRLQTNDTKIRKVSTLDPLITETW